MAAICTMNCFDYLSDDVILKILHYIETWDLCNVCRVNKRFERLCSDRAVIRYCDFEKGFTVTDGVLKHFLRISCCHVESLNLNHCYWISGKTVETVVTRCKNLRELSLIDCNLTAKKICRLIAALSDLTLLAFTVRNIREFDLELNGSSGAQRSIQNLRTLCLHFKVELPPMNGVSISIQFTRQPSLFEHCRNLERFHVIGQPVISCGMPSDLLQPHVTKLENLKNLKELSINDAIDPAARIFFFGTLLEISRLQLQFRTLLKPTANFDRYERKADFIKCLKHTMPCIENLDVSRTFAEFPNSVITIEKAPNLKFLNIVESHEVDSNSLSSIAIACPGLVSLNCRNCPKIFYNKSLQVEDTTGLQDLVFKCQYLQHLNLSAIHFHKVSDVAWNLVSLICHTKELQSLAISPCCLAVIPLENPGSNNPSSGKRHLASTSETVPSGKRRRIGVQKPNVEVGLYSKASTTNHMAGNNDLQRLANDCLQIKHFELINAGLIRPAFNKENNNGLMPKHSCYTPCQESVVVGDHVLSSIGRWTELQSLQLSGLPGVQNGSSLITIATHCVKLKKLFLAYYGSTALCVFTRSLNEALKKLKQLQYLRIEQPYLKLDKDFFDACSNCDNLTGLCVLSRESSLAPAPLSLLMEKVKTLIALQLFTGDTLASCKKIQSHIQKSFEKDRPALVTTIFPLLHEDVPRVVNSIPTKHLEELTILSSHVSQKPPGWRW